MPHNRRRGRRGSSSRGNESENWSAGENEDEIELGAVDRVFQRLAGLLQGDRRAPDYSYRTAEKHGAYKFTLASNPVDAHNWIERMERVFVQVQVPDDRKVGLATQFLEEEPHYWWVSVSNGDPTRFTWAQFRDMFYGKYFSPTHMSNLQDEFLTFRKGDMSVMEFQQRFLYLAQHVPNLVQTEATKIHRFIRGLGGEYQEKMEAVVYPSFDEAATAALRIETGRRDRGSDAPTQGPSKRVASASGSGSSASSGRSSGNSGNSGAGGRTSFRGEYRRPGQSQFSRQQSRQAGGDRGGYGNSSGGQSFQSGQYRVQRCFACGATDHLVRECPIVALGTLHSTTQSSGQMSTGASGSGGRVGSAARGGNQQGRGQRGRPMTTARLHALIAEEEDTGPELVSGRDDAGASGSAGRQ